MLFWKGGGIMTQIDNEHVSPEIKAILCAMQQQIDDLNKRVIAAETRADRAEARVLVLEKQIQAKDAEIAHLKETVSKYQHMLFGSHSEKTKYLNVGTQMSLFGEEQPEDIPVVAPSAPVAGYNRQQKSKKERDDCIELMIVSGRFPVETKIVDLPTVERFDSEGKPLEYLGVETIRRTIEATQPEYHVQILQRRIYASPRDKETQQRAEVKAPEVAPAVIPHSIASSSLIADIAQKKFEYGLPLYRQERALQDMGVPLRRNILANWMILSSQYIERLWEHMKAELLTQGVIHTDETPYQVLVNEKGNPRAKLQMWAYVSGKACLRQIACFEYQPSREGKHPAAFLEGFKGCVITDGYSAYHTMKALKLGGCWAHARRKWFDVLPKELKLKDSKNDRLQDKPKAAVDPNQCVQLQLLLLINRLFRLEETYEKEGLTPVQRLARRQSESAPVLTEYWTLVEGINDATGNLGKAVTYSLNQKKYLMAFMSHGEMEISNNQVENAIRNFVVGRKNWLFSATEAGAKATAMYYSLIVTAKANGLDVFKYLVHVLDAMSQAINGKRLLSDDEMDRLLDELMPWSTDMQERFEAPDPFLKSARTAS